MPLTGLAPAPATSSGADLETAERRRRLTTAPLETLELIQDHPLVSLEARADAGAELERRRHA